MTAVNGISLNSVVTPTASGQGSSVVAKNLRETPMFRSGGSNTGGNSFQLAQYSPGQGGSSTHERRPSNSSSHPRTPRKTNERLPVGPNSFTTDTEILPTFERRPRRRRD